MNNQSETAGPRIGTCSWKYPSWKGLIYSDQKDPDYLKEYAEHYDTVEVDQWFWSLHGPGKIKLPDQKTVQEYVQSVPDHFRFSIKIPNSVTLTHFYKRTHPDLTPNPGFLSVDLFHSFLSSLQPMRDHLGPLMFQFEYLNRQKMDSMEQFLKQFGEFIKKIPDHYDYAVELRNPNYLKEDYFQFLKTHGISHVFVQGYYMPSIFELYDRYGDYIENETVIRLLGADRSGIEERAGGKWDRIVDSKDDELRYLRTMLSHLRDRHVSVYLNVNNHYEGSAPLTIEKIRQDLTSYSDRRIQE